MTLNTPIILVGYSGHSFVVYDILTAMGKIISGYCDNSEKNNLHNLDYYGSENSLTGKEALKKSNFFVSIGNNEIRKKIFKALSRNFDGKINAIHPSSQISKTCKLGFGIMVAANSAVNAFAKVGNGVICNTGSIIEHECTVGDFAHIAPGTVLAGNVSIGTCSFIGANSVVKQGVQIGNYVTVGAGSVIIRDIPDGVTVVGNPGKIIKQKS